MRRLRDQPPIGLKCRAAELLKFPQITQKNNGLFSKYGQYENSFEHS